MIVVFSCVVSTMDTDKLKRIYTQLPPEKQRRLAALRNDTQRCHSLAAYSLLERAAVIGYPVPSLRSLCWTANGKPFFPNIPLEFSLSHAGDRAVCALSDAPIGIDIESLSQPLTDWRQLADIMGFCDIQNKLQFLHTWVIWESYCKQSGKQVRPVNAFNIKPHADGFILMENGQSLPLFCRIYDLFSGYLVALCLPASYQKQPVRFQK